MPDKIKTRVVAAFMGFALGDTLSWSNMIRRTQELPQWLERIRHELESAMRENNITSFPKPFSLNQSPEKLVPGPGDVSEWATWTAILLLQNQGKLRQDILHNAWQSLAAKAQDIHGRISVQAALTNFKEGLTAPQTGRFNPHYFDDAALPRAMMIGIAHAGDPETAKTMAALDASFTQFEDGIWSAAAIAALFSRACVSTSVLDLIQSVNKDIPPHTMTHRTVNHALNGIKQSQSDLLSTALFLNTNICNHIYSYGNIAHEILAALLAILKAANGDRNFMVGCAALIPTAGETLLALSSALGSVMTGKSWIVGELHEKQLTISGISLPNVKGVNVNTVAHQLADLAETEFYSAVKRK